MISLDNIQCTCSACPTQYEGTLSDGRELYFRFRWGRASLSIENEEVYSEQLSDGLDGVLEQEKVFEIIENYLKSENE